MKPLCFVLMPFGKKPDGTGRTVNFDAVYRDIIKPAIEAASLEPIRADEEVVGGIIHKPMFERLMLCDYAVADLTTANANVFYELGIRHGIRPHTTVTVISEGANIPFDLVAVRAAPYALDSLGNPAAPERDRAALTERLVACRDNPAEDSPLFQLVSDWPKPDLARLKTDTFREAVEYSRVFKEKLHRAREAGVDQVRAVEAELNVKDVDPAIIVDLFLSYRAVEAWQEMDSLASRMSRTLAHTVMIREQHAFALNRLGRRGEAEKILREIIDQHGPNSETNGLLGRVYKDRWKDAMAGSRLIEARGYLQRAIQTYLDGFNADWRDAYPGINAVTLMEFEDEVNPKQAELLPVISFAVKRRLESGAADYWDYATFLELRVLARDQKGAEEALMSALVACREVWEPKTTADNLRLIIDARRRRGEDAGWIEEIETELRNRATFVSH